MICKLEQHPPCDKIKAYSSSLRKGCRFDSNKSAIDLRIWKRRRFENTLKSDCDLR